MTEPNWGRGTAVEVRSASEILATLDETGSLEGLPFIPEMVASCGRRFVVASNAERMCDTIKYSGARRIPSTVLLDAPRCDGAAHDGCQTACRLLWKTAWLRRVGPDEPPAREDEAGAAALRACLAPHVRPLQQPGDGPARWRCQLTELYRASGPASRFPYLGELTSGNVALGRYVQVVARAAVWESKRKLGRLPNHCFAGTSTPLRRPPLDLKPGEWVRIRTAEEIAPTIDLKGGTRGLWFDREMLQFCGKAYRVKERATRFIHDDGTFVVLKSAAVKLEDVACTGDYSLGRWFCPRALHPFWREDWLERVPAP